MDVAEIVARLTKIDSMAPGDLGVLVYASALGEKPSPLGGRKLTLRLKGIYPAVRSATTATLHELSYRGLLRSGGYVVTPKGLWLDDPDDDDIWDGGRWDPELPAVDEYVHKAIDALVFLQRRLVSSRGRGREGGVEYGGDYCDGAVMTSQLLENVLAARNDRRLAARGITVRDGRVRYKGRLVLLALDPLRWGD